MPPPKPVGRARAVDKLKKAKGVAVSSKKKLGKRNTPAEFKKARSSAELIQPRPSGTPSGLKKHHPSALKDIQLSVNLTKLTKPELPSSPTESKAFLTELEKSGPLAVPAELKKRGPGHPKFHGPSPAKDIQQRGKKRKAVDVSPAPTVKRVKLKNHLDVSSSKGKGQKNSTSLKSGQLSNKKIARPGSHSAKTKSKVSENEPIPGLEYGSTLQQTLAHLPLLKAKSPKPKQKIAQKTSPVSKPVIKAAQIKKKNVQFPHSKAAVKRAQQILSQKSKTKSASVTKKKSEKRNETVKNKQLPHSKTSVKKGKQILSQKSKMNKTASASRKKVAKKLLTVVETFSSHDNEGNKSKRKDIHTFYEINIPVGMEPFVNKQFWQPSVILKKLEDIVILGINKSTKELDTDNTEDIKLATGSQIPVNVSEENTPEENCEPIVQHPNSKDNLVNSLTLDHSNRKKSHVITGSYRGKSKKSVDEKEVAERISQSVSKEEGKKNKIVNTENIPNHPNPDPPKGTKVQHVRSLTSGNSAVEEPHVQKSAVKQKVKGRSKLLDSTSEELEKQKQGLMKKPRSRTLLKEKDDMNLNESVQKTVCVDVPENTKMANNKDSPLISQHSKTENKEISHIDKTDTSILSKRRTIRNSDKVVSLPVSQDVRNEIVKASSVDSQSDDTPKRKRRHSDLAQDVPVKRTRLQLKDMAGHNKSLNTEQTNVDEAPIPKKKEENVKTAPLRKTKESTKDKAKQIQDIQMEGRLSCTQAESQKSEETAKSSKSVANTAKVQINESHSSQKQVVVADSNICVDSVESPGTDIDSDVSSYLVTKENNLLRKRQEDPNISDQLKSLDPSFIEEANLSELLNSDSSCDNMSWNSLNVIANQRKAEKLRKDLFILQRNLAILKEAKAKRDELYKDISKQMKDYITKQVSVRSEKI